MCSLYYYCYIIAHLAFFGLYWPLRHKNQYIIIVVVHTNCDDILLTAILCMLLSCADQCWSTLMINTAVLKAIDHFLLAFLPFFFFFFLKLKDIHPCISIQPAKVTLCSSQLVISCSCDDLLLVACVHARNTNIFGIKFLNAVLSDYLHLIRLVIIFLLLSMWLRVGFLSTAIVILIRGNMQKHLCAYI